MQSGTTCGGGGTNRGGDGLFREIEVTEPATATLLAAYRPDGARGSAGGGPGARGYAWKRVSEVWIEWDGDPIGLAPGDRVRVQTPGGGGWGRSEQETS